MRRISPNEANATFLAAGLSPLTDYPGNAHAPWKSRCNTCGVISSPTVSRVRSGSGCRTCRRALAAKARRIDEGVGTGH